MGHQETSHQQVMSYLIGGGDFYVSHTFEMFNWYEFVNAVDRFDAECMAFSYDNTSVDDEEDAALHQEQISMNILTDLIEFSSHISDYVLCPFDQEFTNLCLCHIPYICASHLKFWIPDPL
jgi:hypothetical protein